MIAAFICSFSFAWSPVMNTPATDKTTVDVAVVSTWTGSFATADMDLLPETTRGVSLIRSRDKFDTIWKHMNFNSQMPANPPDVDFQTQTVVLIRNVRHLNRIISVKVARKDNTLLVSARQTRTARPINKSVYLAVFVVPLSKIEKVVVQ